MTPAVRTALSAAVAIISYAFLAAVVASPVHADAYRLSVLQIETDEVGDDELAPMFMKELRAVLAARSDIAPVDTRVTLTQLSLGQGCNTAEGSCLLRIANNLNVDGILFGKLTHEGGEPVAILRRYDTRSASIDASALVAFGPQVSTPAAMRVEAKRLVNALLGEATPPLAPKQAVEPVATELTADRDTPSESHGISTRTIAGFSLLGGAAVSVGLTVLSFVQIDHSEHNKNFENYRVAVGQSNTSTKDVCDEASGGMRYGLSEANFRAVRSSCNTGLTFEILQYVFLGSAVVTGGLAAFLLLGNDGDSDHAQETGVKHISLQPNFTRTGATVTAHMHF